MKKFILIFHVIFFFLILQEIKAQDLKFADLGILQSHPLDYDIDYLSRRGWEFNSSKSETDSIGETYKQATWSLNKSSYSDKAEAWLYLHMYLGYEDILVYQTSKTNFNLIKEEVKKTNFSLIKSDVSDNRLYNVYENGNYRILFETSRSRNTDYDYSYSSDELYYTVTIVNYNEYFKRIYAYEGVQAKLREEVRIADSLENLRKIEAARIAEQRRQESIALEEKRKLQIFLAERKFTVYDYSLTNPSQYDKIESSIIQKIRDELINAPYSAEIDMDLVLVVDTLVNTSCNFSVRRSNNEVLLGKIKSLCKEYELQPASKYGYSVNAQAVFKVNVLLDNQIVIVRKNNVGTKFIGPIGDKYSSEINALISSAPMGRFRVSISKRVLNGSDFSNNKVLSYSRIGGPTNAFRSLLIPGWGVSRVSGGQKSGLVSTITVYGLIATSAIFKVYSDSEYKKYHNATDQSEMDSHYQNANFSNKAFLICAGTAATVWLLDVILVAAKGFKNNSESRTFKKSLSIYYNPEFHQTGLALRFNF